MAEFIFQMVGTEKVLPNGRNILQPTWLSFFPDAKIGVIGHNGSGKSTLLKIMAQVDDSYSGECIWAPNKRVGYLAQEPELDESLSVRENIELGLKEIRDLLIEFDQVSEAFGTCSDDEMDKLIDRQAELQDQIDAADGWELDRRVDIAMNALRVPDGDAAVTHLSGGEKRRVALCRLLLSRPDFLLLDEPTNHLDAESVAWLERHLSEFPGCLVCVTHDRYFLDNISQWILELDHGKAYPFEGNYSGWLQQKQERMRQEKKAESSRQRQLAEELSWIQMSPKARQKKSKARISAYDDLVSQSQAARRRTDSTIRIPLTRRLGDVVIDATQLAKSYDQRSLMDDLNFSLPPGGIVGVIGPNGAGKTTLFRMLVGQEQPDEGQLKVGETVDLAYVDQSRDALEPDKTVWESISGGHDLLQIGGREVNSRAYVSAFNFRGSDQQQKVGTLSGGERNRVHLARLLKTGCNLILLDEPTNDLDVDTLRSLEEALLLFPGCAVVISHDRWFLDRIATHILAFEGDSQVVWHEGNYESYERDRRRRLGSAADQPIRIKYRRLDA